MEISRRLVLLLGAIALLNPLQADTKVSVTVSDGRSSQPADAGKKGPPPWAPAHGYRAKHVYHYFPGHDIYYEPSKKNYFYLEAGKWKVSARLPSAIQIDAKNFVEVGMNADKPYQFHNDIKSAYPSRAAVKSPSAAPVKNAKRTPEKDKGKSQKR